MEIFLFNNYEIATKCLILHNDADYYLFFK